MTTTLGEIAPTGAVAQPPVQGRVITPSAMAGPQASAVFALGEVLKDVLHAVPVYKNETQVLSAVTTVENFVKSFIKPSEVPAVATGEERASVEDVSQRTPPPGMVGAPGPVNTLAIDYDKLAQALIRAQAAASTPEVTQ